MSSFEPIDASKFTVANLEAEQEELGKGVLLSNLEANAYHKGPGFGSTRLSRTALHSYQHMLAADPKQTEAMLLGSLVHTMVLEPETYADRYAVRPPGSARNTKAGKAVYEAWEQEKGNREEIKAETRDLAKGIADAVLSHPIAGRIIAKSTHKELSMYRALDHGILCHGRLDAYDAGTALIVDLKTTEDARPDAFSRTLVHYALQAALYTRLMFDITGLPHEFLIVAVEKKEPFGIRLYKVGANTIHYGRDLLETALNRIHLGLQNSDFVRYAYLTVPTELDIPSWVINKHTTDEETDYDNDNFDF